MNPAWVSALIAGATLGGQVLWTTINLRIENRLLRHIDELKDWIDLNYVRKPDSAARKPRPAGKPSNFSKKVANFSADVDPI